MKDNVLTAIAEIHKREKAMGHAPISVDEYVVNSINLLLFEVEQIDMRNAVVALKVLIDRLGLHDVCHIRIAPEFGYKAILFYEGKETEV